MKTNLSTLIALLLLLTGFQNCNENHSGPSSASDLRALNNNEVDSGTPYEGKVYANLGGLCADGTELQSRIVLSSSSIAQLNRENCQDINPLSLTTTDFEINSDTETLVYRNQNYQFIGVGSLGITNLSISNDSNNFYYSYTYEGKPSWLQIYLDTDNNPATGYSHFGIGADFMIENDNVWKYSGKTGSRQNTWAWTSLVSANKNLVSQSISWSFPRTAIGSPAHIKLIGQTSLGARTGVMSQIPQ